MMRPGDLVVCIKDNWEGGMSSGWLRIVKAAGVPLPRLRDIYTIRGSIWCPHDTPMLGLSFEEILMPNGGPTCCCGDIELTFGEYCFRLIDRQTIKAFRKMVAPNTLATWHAPVKIPETV
jgi:hypothetical protein